MISRVARAAAAAASVLLLAGCSSMFAPDPTAAPSETASPSRSFTSIACHPSTTRFVWVSSAVDSRYEAVSTRVRTYNSHRAGVSSDAPDPDYSFGADQGALAADQGYTALGAVFEDLDAWAPVLAGSLRSYTSVPADIGKTSSIIDSTRFTPPKPHAGSWVRVVVAKSESYRFTMICEDGTTATGRFGGILPATATEITLHCDTRSHPSDAPQRAVARAQCPQA